MKNLKLLIITLLICSSFSLTSQDQKPEYKNNFENYENGTILTEPGVKKRLFTWGKETKFTAVYSEGMGNKRSNGFAKSSTNQGVYCVKYFTLEAGSSYIWKIAVKLEGGDQSKRIQYALKVTSGKGENSHNYVSKIIKDSKMGEWNEFKNEFTVKEGAEKINVTVYRWADGTSMCIDDFLVKKIN